MCSLIVDHWSNNNVFTDLWIDWKHRRMREKKLINLCVKRICVASWGNRLKRFPHWLANWPRISGLNLFIRNYISCVVLSISSAPSYCRWTCAHLSEFIIYLRDCAEMAVAWIWVLLNGNRSEQASKLEAPFPSSILVTTQCPLSLYVWQFARSVEQRIN